MKNLNQNCFFLIMELFDTEDEQTLIQPFILD